MNHDITHCQGVGLDGKECGRRYLCVRFAAHKELSETDYREIPYYSYYQPKDPSECSGMYWPSGEEEHE